MDESSLLAKATAAAVAAAGGLLTIVWGNVQSKLKKHDDHIERLYSNAEADRKQVRDLHDDAMAELRDLHRDTMDAILKIKS